VLSVLPSSDSWGLGTKTRRRHEGQERRCLRFATTEARVSPAHLHVTSLIVTVAIVFAMGDGKKLSIFMFS
jgi:hypothetical protein